MDRLADLTHFPATVNAGATLNVLATVSVTWWLLGSAHRFTTRPYALAVWIAFILALNLLPVVFLRAIRFNHAPIPALSHMDFFRDQHRFSDWVYLAASAHMAFWIILSWSIFSISRTPTTLFAVLAAAFLFSFSPILVRTAVRPTGANREHRTP